MRVSDYITLLEPLFPETYSATPKKSEINSVFTEIAVFVKLCCVFMPSELLLAEKKNLIVISFIILPLSSNPQATNVRKSKLAYFLLVHINC